LAKAAVNLSTTDKYHLMKSMHRSHRFIYANMSDPPDENADCQCQTELNLTIKPKVKRNSKQAEGV